MKFCYQTATISALTTALVLGMVGKMQFSVLATNYNNNTSLQTLPESTENKKGKSDSGKAKQLVSEVCDLEPLPVKTECYRLTVPENRFIPSSRTIDLAVVILI